jgi:DNA repair protein RecN (Recombination protein N)
MLKHLKIKNFVLIAQLDLEFDTGLNIITGETGAGKSIILDALSLVLGERARTGLVRQGEDSAFVEAVFYYNPNDSLGKAIDKTLAQAGIEDSEGQLIVKRVVSLSGPSRCFVNGSPTVLKILQQLGDLLVDVHGQHEHQSLLHPDFYLSFLDAYGSHGKLVEDVGLLFNRRQQLQQEIAELQSERENSEREADLLQYQVDEIKAAEVDNPAEIEQLRDELERLRHVEDIRLAASQVQQLADGDESGDGGIVAILGEMERLSERLSALDTSMRWLSDDLLSARGYLEDIGRRLVDYAERMEADPQRLAEAEERLNLLSQLAAKHGGSLERVLEYYQEASDRLANLLGSDQKLHGLRAELLETDAQLAKLALSLSKKRGKVANKLSRLIAGELKQLGMEDCVFSVDLSSRESELGLKLEDGRCCKLYPTGIDQIEFNIAVNRGTSPQPLRMVASGGEISRIMLGIKSVLAQAADIATMVFDEIDAGIGGTMSEVVGRKLAELSRYRQLICITHLAPIACRADQNYLVEKERGKDSTLIGITQLNKKEKIDEIVRLLGAAGDSANARKMAREMITTADSERA